MDNLRGKNFLFEIAKNSITPELISSVIGSIKTAPTEIEEDENPADSEVDFKFNEDEYLEELYDYISSTYGQHYSLSKIQSTEFIMDAGHGEGLRSEISSSMHSATERRAVRTAPTCLRSVTTL
jgi:hypothetical protein